MAHAQFSDDHIISEIWKQSYLRIDLADDTIIKRNFNKHKINSVKKNAEVHLRELRMNNKRNDTSIKNSTVHRITSTYKQKHVINIICLHHHKRKIPQRRTNLIQQ